MPQPEKARTQQQLSAFLHVGQLVPVDRGHDAPGLAEVSGPQYTERLGCGQGRSVSTTWGGFPGRGNRVGTAVLVAQHGHLGQGTLGVASREPSTVSHFKTERGTSLETL